MKAKNRWRGSRVKGQGYLFITCYLLLATCYFVIFSKEAFAGVSINVPIHHWSYQALEHLAVYGMSGAEGLRSKPMSRLQMARIVAQAMEYVQGKEGFSVLDEARIERAEDMLYRLMDEFRDELIELGVSRMRLDDRQLGRSQFKLGDPIRTEKVYAGLSDEDGILLENRRGWRVEDGLNFRGRLRGWAMFEKFMAFSVEPAVRISGGDIDLDLEEAYIKLGCGNVELELGRDTLWWGPGYHGAMLLSDNAFPLNMVKLSNQEPFRLPWEFRKMGLWNAVFFVSQLEEERVVPKPYLAGLRTEYNPLPYFTFGMSRTAILGGEGRPHLSLSDYWRIFRAAGKTEFKEGRLNTDQLASFDFRLRFPRSTQGFFQWLGDMEVYWEYAGEDRFSPWENEAPGYLAGIYMPDLFKWSGLDFRAEYAKTSDQWYVHGTYRTGYNYKGSILGHHMGTDADDIFFMLSKVLENGVTCAIKLDFQREGLSLTNVQRKSEFGIDLGFKPFEEKDVKLKAYYEFEYFDNFANVADNKAKNHIVEIGAQVKF